MAATLLWALWIAAGAGTGGPGGVMRPHLFAVPPIIDGNVTDGPWQDVAPLPLVNIYPSFQSPMTERTEIRFGYDAAYVYASIRAWDSEPSRIRATTLHRDRWQTDEEFVIILDTFADGQNAAMFLVTPAGIRVDNELTHDADPGRGEWMNRDWNVPWDAAAVTLEDGWSAEMRIPFSSLRFKDDNGRVAMRFKSYRYLPRKGENQIFPATRPDAGAVPHFKPSLGQQVVFEGVRAAVPVYVTPYAAATSAARGTDTRDLDVGVDVKLLPTRSTTVDLTVNTDFAQVEVDRLQVNLTRFPLRFPERRPFFLERAGLFAVGLGGEDTLFNSRRVGLSDDGAPRPILGGARLVSRVSGWDIGALDVEVGAGDASSRENIGVVRAQRVSTAGHTVGVTGTTHARAGGTDVAGAADASFAFGQERLSSVWATSGGSAPAAERSRGALRWQRGAAQGVSYSGEYRFTGSAFRPSVGFVRISNAHEVVGIVRQSWRPGGSAGVRRHGWELESLGRRRRSDGVMEEARVSAQWNVETRGGVSGSGRVQTTEEDVPIAFGPGPNTTVAPGRYRSTTGRFEIGSPPTSALRVFANVEAGGFYGGRRFGWRVEPVWTPSRHFESWIIVDSTRFTGLAGGASSINLVVVGARAALNTKVFADLSLQRASGAPAVGQVRFRWNPSEGHDLWVVGERGRSSTGDVSHAVTVKYARLFTIGGS